MSEQVITISGLGEFRVDKYRYWTSTKPIPLHGWPIGLRFSNQEGSPSDRSVAFYRQIENRWDELWSGILKSVANRLEDDGPQGERARFLCTARPAGIILTNTTIGSEQWEILTEPDIYGGHVVTVQMRGFQFVRFTLDG